jgi:hypothetical protein
MTVDLKPEQEEVVSRAIAAGVVGTVHEAFELGLQSIRLRLAMRAAAPEKTIREEQKRKLDEFVHSHPRGERLLTDDDISRESIYGNRGL